MATSRYARGKLASFLLPEETLDEFRVRARRLGCPQALVVQGLVEARLSGEVTVDLRAVNRPVDPRTDVLRIRSQAIGTPE